MDFKQFHPAYASHYSEKDETKMLAPIKKERKFIHLILESDAMSPQKWNYITYNLYDILPQPKINELMNADHYHFQMESISWDDKLYDQSYMISLDNVMNDTVFSNKPALKTVLETSINDDFFAFDHEGYRGIKTTDKAWLQQGKLTVAFKDNQGSMLADNAFGMNTRYTVNILLTYE